MIHRLFTIDVANEVPLPNMQQTFVLGLLRTVVVTMMHFRVSRICAKEISTFQKDTTYSYVPAKSVVAPPTNGP